MSFLTPQKHQRRRGRGETFCTIGKCTTRAFPLIWERGFVQISEKLILIVQKFQPKTHRGDRPPASWAPHACAVTVSHVVSLVTL